MNDPTYDSRTVTLHWISALLVLGLWIAGQSIGFLPRGEPRVPVRSLHITAGVVLALVLIARIAWRTRGGVRLAPAEPGLLGRLAVWVHYLLYALMVTIVVLGLASVWFRGDTLFNLFRVPAFDPANRQLGRNSVEIHGLLANILLGVALAHGAAALWHQKVRKDGVLRRMWPSLPPGQGR